MEFNVGDKVRRKQGSGNCSNTVEGEVYEVHLFNGGTSPTIGKRINGAWHGSCQCQSTWELINKSEVKTIMSNLLEKFAMLTKSEPEKSFRKAGITNGDDQLTSEGQTVFLSWLLKQHGDKFKIEVVDPILLTEENK